MNLSAFTFLEEQFDKIEKIPAEVFRFVKLLLEFLFGFVN